MIIITSRLISSDRDATRSAAGPSRRAARSRRRAITTNCNPVGWEPSDRFGSERIATDRIGLDRSGAQILVSPHENANCEVGAVQQYKTDSARMRPVGPYSAIIAARGLLYAV